MGGLQIRQYLTLEGARKPAACLFLGTPHRATIIPETPFDPDNERLRD